MTWEELETLFGIKFKLEDGTFRPVNEWLDDLYLRFNSQEAWHILLTVLYNGDALFRDVLSHKK